VSNVPAVSRFENLYSEQIDFIHIDWDDPGTAEIAKRFGVLRRSTYVLIDADGNIVWTWIGPLTQAAVTGKIDEILAGS
jgi:hypothetical protein